MKSLSLTKPHILIVVGLPGSGKSMFANKFAETFAAPLISYEVQAQAGIPHDLIKTTIQLQLTELLKTGATLVVDAYTDTRTERVELAHQAREAGYEPLLVWVQTEPATTKLRSTKPPRKSGKKPMSGEDYDKLARRFTQPSAVEKAVVISGKHTYATQARTVLARLAEPRTEQSRQPTIPSRNEADQKSGRRSITIN